MSQSSAKLFVPDQAIYWLDANTKLGIPIDKREWLQTHNLPEFADSPKEDEKTPWTRIDGIHARNEFLKNLGQNVASTKRKLLCFTASAGVGKSIALEQIAYLRSLDPEHVVIRYHFSQLPTTSTHFWLAGEKQRSLIQSESIRPLVLALLNTKFPTGDEDQNWPTLSDAYEQAILLLIETKIQKGQVTLIVDGLDEFNGIEEGATKGTRKDRAKALKSLLNDDKCRNLHCVVAGRPYSIVDDNWADLFESKGPSARTNGGSEWEFCLAALFTEEQSKRFLGRRYIKLSSLQSQTPLTPRHLEVIRTLPEERFANLHSLACVYWEMLQASLVRDLTRKDKKDLYGPPKVPVKPEQYIGYLAALAFLTLESPGDLKSLNVDDHKDTLFDRVMQIRFWKHSNDSLDRKEEVIAELNSSTIEFNYWRQGNLQVVWKDRTVMDFFAALWLVRYATDEQREAICKQVPRRGKQDLYENRRDLWTFIAGMPWNAFEKFENLPKDARWNELVHRLFQPFDDAKRPTQLMYIAWEELKRGITNKDRKVSATKIMDSFTKQYQDLRDGGSEASTIIEEDLIFEPIEPLDNGSWNVAVGHPNEKKNQPRRIELHGPYSVSKFPITRRLYKLFDCNHEVRYQEDFKKYCKEQRCPVIRVNWYDAQMFAIWSESRLPTEWEWEYACRANRRATDHQKLVPEHWRVDPIDNEALKMLAWFNLNSQNHTWPVNAKTDGTHTNDFQLVDMLGNVWEWTGSQYEEGEVSRVLRGGSFDDCGRSASASCRAHSGPTDAYIVIGFRVARAP